MTAGELRGSGLDREDVRALVRRGLLVQIGRGIFAPAEAGATRPEQHDRLLAATAAVVLAGPEAVVSHEDAAIVHGLALLARPPADVSITRPPSLSRGRRLRPGVRSHTAALPGRHVVVADGFPVTSVARTVVDLGRSLPFAAGVVTADAALHGHRTSLAHLYGVLHDCAGWPGSRRAAGVLDFSHPQAESPLESISRVAFRDGGLPAPVLQAGIAGDRGFIGRVDFLWQQQRTIAEADGAMKYADPDRARQQLRRDTELRRAGYEVIHFSWYDITARTDEVIAQIRAAFARTARLGGAGYYRDAQGWA